MRILPVLGKFLISVGVGVLLFVAWTLWGTGIATRQQQHRLSDEFDHLPRIHVAVNAKVGHQGPPASYDPKPGEPVFRIKIPKIQLNDGKGYMVVEGVDTDDLSLGPGHYPHCRPGFTSENLCTKAPEVWPGQNGRVIVSGHRTTHLAPFYDLEQVQPGNHIILETRWGDFTYIVTKQKIVLPTDIGIADPLASKVPEIVLTTCNPRFSASQRLVVFARLSESKPA
jgi:sortase A